MRTWRSNSFQSSQPSPRYSVDDDADFIEEGFQKFEKDVALSAENAAEGDVDLAFLEQSLEQTLVAKDDFVQEVCELLNIPISSVEGA